MKQKQRNDDNPRGFVFYTRDYFGDVQVRLMPADLRLVWVETLFLMDQSPRRGVLLQGNGTPYSLPELSHIINCDPETIERAFKWVVERKIADIDRSARVLCNRRMIRDEKRRQINSKNARKGGNPLLVKQRLQKPKKKSDNRSVNSRARVPESETETEYIQGAASPDDLLDENLGGLETLAAGLKTQPLEIPAAAAPKSDPPASADPPPEPPKVARRQDPAAALFEDAYCAMNDGRKYPRKPGDFVQLAALRKREFLGPDDQPTGWSKAVANYFASEDSPQRTLGDLANPVRFDVFAKTQLDRFGKAKNGNRNGSSKLSREQERISRNHETVQRLRSRLDGTDGAGTSEGNNGNAPRLVRSRASGSE